MEDLEQKDGEAQWSTVRHMLSIKKPAINTRYTAPGQHDSSPGGGGGGGGSSEEGGKQEEKEKEWKKEREQERLEVKEAMKDMTIGENLIKWKGGRRENECTDGVEKEGGSRRCWGTGAKLKVVAKKPNANPPDFHLFLPRALFSVHLIAPKL